MIVKFRDDATLVIVPENTIESMALRYWAKEYENHGEKMIDIETEVPPQLGVVE